LTADLVNNSLFNPLIAKLNPICYLLALLGAHPLLHVSRIRINLAADCVSLNDCSGNQIENNKIDEASSTYGGRGQAFTGFWWEILRGKY